MEDDLGTRLGRQERRLRLLLSYLVSPALRARIELDDLVQEVYVRALTADELPELGDEGDVELWRFLVRLARNATIDAARAMRAAKRDGRTARLGHGSWSVAGPRASQILSRTWGPATRARASELERALEDRFEALSPEHRRVIGLRQFEGLSARETAERMGRGEAAVHSLYRRALMAWDADEILRDSRGESAGGRRSEAP